MSLATRKRPYWTCRRCGYRNLRAHVKCRGYESLPELVAPCEGRRPKKPTRAHRRVLQGDTYPLFVQAARDIHGVTDESCCVCGKPRTLNRKNDRDHDHNTGLPRGLACPGNTGCNMLMLPWISASVALAIADEKELQREPDAARWRMISDYLWRVEAYYSDRSV